MGEELTLSWSSPRRPGRAGAAIVDEVLIEPAPFVDLLLETLITRGYFTDEEIESRKCIDFVRDCLRGEGRGYPDNYLVT